MKGRQTLRVKNTISSLMKYNISLFGLIVIVFYLLSVFVMQQAALASNFLTYDNHALGIRILYPADWKKAIQRT